MSQYLAHIDGDRVQTVEAHLAGVSRRCAAFAEAFGAAEQGAWIGLAHDIGKYSAEFQRRLQGGKRVDHATAGAVECVRADFHAVWAASCVAGHHSGLADVGVLSDTPGSDTLTGRLKKGLSAQPGQTSGSLPDYQAYRTEVSLTPAPPAPPGYGREALADAFLIRMLYSCLVDADFLDTEEFMSGGTVRRGGEDPAPVLLRRLWAMLEERRVTPWLEYGLHPSPELTPGERAILQKRCEILRTCRDSGERPRGLYTLTVPTGGGKTVSSLAFALRHAVRHGMERVIYVIPYTSIIEQTAEVFREILGAENVLEHHSGASHEAASGREGRRGGADVEDCGVNSLETRAALAAENWDAPVIVTTAVQFFESLYANRPGKCRKLHNIANSVLIFDEAQTLPTPHLLPCVAAIAYLVKQFRATAVLCTATQPALDGLFREYGLEPEELCPGTARLYEQFRRVTFRVAGTMDADALAERLGELPQVLCVVNTRRSAQEVFRKLPEEGSFHLSTLMYPAHRREVLAEIRRRLADGLPCRVVSTSLIEAGVDVDFPAVWRETAGLDSILQAAGRCNREGRRPVESSIVTVFDGVSRTPDLLKANIGAAREVLQSGAEPDRPETVTRYFTTYRDFAGAEGMDMTQTRDGLRMGVVEAFRKGFRGRNMPFRTVAENFHMIESATKTVYIPGRGGEKLLERFRYAGPSRELYRQLGQYAVNLYERQYQDLLDAGYTEPLDEDSAVLRDRSRYQEKTGLSVEDGNPALLMI